MDQNDNQSVNSSKKTKKTISTKITCVHCGRDQKVTIEIPEETNTPKMVWEE